MPPPGASLSILAALKQNGGRLPPIRDFHFRNELS